MSYTPGLRSKESVERAFLKLVNSTDRVVDVYWINYASKLIRYTTMPPHTEVSLDTYSTHPWIFRDNRTSEMLHVKNQEVFWPEPWILTRLRARTFIHIHLPMKSLKLTCIWKTVSLVQTAEAIDQLEIPKCLIDELHEVHKTFEDYRESLEKI